VHPFNVVPIIPKITSITGKYIPLLHHRDGLTMPRQIHGKTTNKIFPNWMSETTLISTTVRSLDRIQKYTNSRPGCIKYFLTNNVHPPFFWRFILATEPITPVPSLRDYYKDLDSIIAAASDGESKSFAYKRLQYLDGKWNLYILLNERQEMLDTKVSLVF
jgi:hypothetical protein